MSLNRGDHCSLHVCNDCQYRQHRMMMRPATSGKEGFFCHACGHLGIGSRLDCVIGDWLKVEILASNYTKGATQ